MGSTENSDAIARGFVFRGLNFLRRRASDPSSQYHKSLTGDAPLRRARIIFLTLCAAAAISTGIDLVRAERDAITALDQTSERLASALSRIDPALAPAELLLLARAERPDLGAYLFDNDNKLTAKVDGADRGTEAADDATFTIDGIAARRSITGPLGTISLLQSHQEIAEPVGQRALFVFGFLITGGILYWLRPRRQAIVSDAAPISHEALMEALPVGVACWDKAGFLISSNRRYRALFDLPPTTTPRGAPYASILNRILQSGELRLLRDDDDGRQAEFRHGDAWLEVDDRPLSEGGFITIVTEITSAKEVGADLTQTREDKADLTQKLQEEKVRADAANRSKASFLAHLSHDIRTPLNHIIGFADLMGHQTYGPLGHNRYLDYVNGIKTSGESLLTCFVELLELAQLETGQSIVNREALAVDDVLMAIEGRFRAQAERSGIHLAISQTAETSLLADRHLLQRMIGNLVENALRFAPAGGSIKLAAWSGSDGVVVEISDTGIGIPEERLARLTQPFEFGDATFTGDGVGLGIAISRAIAQLCGGQLVIESSPALGTTVAISLPLRQANRAAESRAA